MFSQVDISVNGLYDGHCGFWISGLLKRTWRRLSRGVALSWILLLVLSLATVQCLELAAGCFYRVVVCVVLSPVFEEPCRGMMNMEICPEGVNFPVYPVTQSTEWKPLLTFSLGCLCLVFSFWLHWNWPGLNFSFIPILALHLHPVWCYNGWHRRTTSSLSMELLGKANCIGNINYTQWCHSIGL